MELGDAERDRRWRASSASRRRFPAYPSIFIGAADVYPIEMVAAYTTFATLGNRAQPIGDHSRRRQRRATCSGSPSPSRVPVMSQEEAWLMVSVMKDVVQRGTAAGASVHSSRHPAGGKTGTTNDGTDVWFIGYTSDLVAGVWMGFDKPQKIKANAQGGRARRAGVDGVHERGLSAQAGAARLADAAGHRHAADRRHDQHARVGVLSEHASSAREFFIPGNRSDSRSATCTTDRRCIRTRRASSAASTRRARIRPTGVTTSSGGQIIVDSTADAGHRARTAAPIRPARPPPRDTSRRLRDSAIFALPPRDSRSMRVTRPPDTTAGARDSIRRDSIRRDSVRRDSVTARSDPPRLDHSTSARYAEHPPPVRGRPPLRN